MDNHSEFLHQSLSDNHSLNFNGTSSDHNDDGWQTVSRRKKNKPRRKSNSPANLSERHDATVDSVWSSVQQDSQDVSMEIIAPQSPSVDDANSDDGSPVNGKIKPKITAAEMDADHLAAYLIDIAETVIDERQQLMRFADYFGKALSSVNSRQFPWLKLFREASVHQLVQIPLAHIPKDVYKISIDWIGLQSIEALKPFVLWLSDQIFAELSNRTSKKPRQQFPSKSLVDIFVVLAMVLRRKPNVLISLLPKLRGNPKDNFLITIWIIAQASEGDLVVGLFIWIDFLLPMLSSTANPDSQSTELILQLLERILSSPKSRALLLSRAVRKNEPLVPPSTLDFFMRTTYPASSARVEATERFKAVYPTLKEIALHGGSESDVATHEILNFTIKAAVEGIPDLSREATDIFVWCLTQMPECYKHWDSLYLDNIEASVVILRKLSDELKLKSAKDSTPEQLKETLKSFRQKNAKAWGKTQDEGWNQWLREADELCEAILGLESKRGQVSKSYGFMKAMLIVSALSAAILSLNVVNQNL